MSALAVILARAGSKGVPGKNAREVGGKPCALWTIEHALASDLVERVAVTTDCPAVAGAARDAGVEVIDRPADLATDNAAVDDAARHCVESLDAPADQPVVILYANVPVRPDDLTDRAMEALLRSGADSVQSFSTVGKHHPWWTCAIGDDGRVQAFDGGDLFHGVHRRQALPPAHIPDGGVIALTPNALFKRIAGVTPGPHAFLGRDRRGVVTQEGQVIDIDSEIDLIVADAVLRARENTPA